MNAMQINAQQPPATPAQVNGFFYDTFGSDCCSDLAHLVNRIKDALQSAWNYLTELFTSLLGRFSSSPTQDEPPADVVLALQNAARVEASRSPTPFSSECREAIKEWLKDDAFGALIFPYTIKTEIRIYPNFTSSKNTRFVFQKEYTHGSESGFPEDCQKWLALVEKSCEQGGKRFDQNQVKVGILAFATKTQQNGREFFVHSSKIFSADRINDVIGDHSFDPDTRRTVLKSPAEIQQMISKELSYIDICGQPATSDGNVVPPGNGDLDMPPPAYDGFS